MTYKNMITCIMIINIHFYNNTWPHKKNLCKLIDMTL